MSGAQIDRLFHDAVSAHAAGDTDRAAALYEQILTLAPRHAGALANLGRIARARKDNAAARAFYERAAAAPDAPAEVFYNLGNLLSDLGEPENARSAYRTAIERAPNLASAYEKLANIEESLGDIEAAASSAERAATLSGDNAALYQRAAILCENAGRIDSAIALYRRALSLKSDLDAASARLAQLLFRQAKGDEAVALLQKSLDRNPNDPTALQNLGFVYRSTGHYWKALKVFEKAREVAPEREILRVEMANCLVNLGRAAEGRADLVRLLETPQGRRKGASSYLMALLYDPDVAPSFIREEHQRLTRDWRAEPRAPVRNRSTRRRKLRVGCLTADFFCNHPVAQFISPVIEAHSDPALGIETLAYDAIPRHDATAKQMSSLCEVRDISGLDDEAAAALIARDNLDILVDLSGHTSGRRLPVLGVRPAPVQACFIGYPSTTGFAAVDYLIADDILIPADRARYYSETIARLSGSFLCFRPPAGMPLATKKARQAGKIVFGSLNHLPKLNNRVVEAWAEILKRTPSADLLLQCAAFAEAETINAVRTLFEAHGVDGARLRLYGPQPFHQALRRYCEIDIALDPFPYNGGATTCHALWMGTPVVTLGGDYFCGRMGASLLSAARRTQWIAASIEEFVRLATELAADRNRLSDEHERLAAEIADTPLCDIERYAAALADLYREMCGVS